MKFSFYTMTTLLVVKHSWCSALLHIFWKCRVPLIVSAKCRKESEESGISSFVMLTLSQKVLFSPNHWRTKLKMLFILMSKLSLPSPSTTLLFKALMMALFRCVLSFFHVSNPTDYNGTTPIGRNNDVHIVFAESGPKGSVQCDAKYPQFPL